MYTVRGDKIVVKKLYNTPVSLVYENKEYQAELQEIYCR